jgi:hypothetical protein
MPSGTVEEHTSELLPEDTLFTGELIKVYEVSKPYRDKNTNEQKTFTKWDWTFKITEGEFEDAKAYGSTMAKLTSHPDNVPRNWAEVLTGRAIDPGMPYDTDDWIGLSAQFEVTHEHYEKNGEDRVAAKVSGLYPLSGQPVRSFDDEPPF